jgi:hypothetical protein
MTDLVVQPGDVIGVRSSGLNGALIRFGAALAGQPNLINHIAVMHHVDANGTPWAVEGRPNGVGWVNATTYLASPWMVNNALQPKTDAQRKLVCDAMQHMLGTAYDWEAIGFDAVSVLALRQLWNRDSDKPTAPPGHVVCSSLAVVGYRQVGLANPSGPWRTIMPSDWDQFCIVNRYNKVT